LRKVEWLVSVSVAIVGATGVVGLECVKILEQRAFPVGTLKLLASARSAGKDVSFRGKGVRVEELGPRAFEGVDVAFFAADAETSRAFAPGAAAAGAVAIDKSSAYRMDASTPLVIPEINGDLLAPLRRAGGKRVGGIVAVPNCSTIIALLPMEPLRRAFGVERFVVSTYQAASGAGAAAMAELEEQTRDVLGGREARPKVFKEPCAFNVFSHDSSMNIETGLNGEEEKMVLESRRIWGQPDLKVNATCVRVGVLRGHSESLTVTLKTPATERQVREALAGGAGLEIVDDRKANSFPTPLKASGGDTVMVGRIRADESQDWTGSGASRAFRGWNLFVSGDQLRTGAALTAVRIAEALMK
jgi:aspartate-semialdehyde dehydrogenase